MIDLKKSTAFYCSIFEFETIEEVTVGELRFAYLGYDGDTVLTLWQQSSDGFSTDHAGLHHSAFEVDVSQPFAELKLPSAPWAPTFLQTAPGPIVRIPLHAVSSSAVRAAYGSRDLRRYECSSTSRPSCQPTTMWALSRDRHNGLEGNLVTSTTALHSVSGHHTRRCVLPHGPVEPGDERSFKRR